MTHILMDIEIVKAMGLSIAFVGVMLSIIAGGISFLIYKISKQKSTQYIKMAGLIMGWAVYISLNLQFSAESTYTPEFFIYSPTPLFAIFVGILTIFLFSCFFSRFIKIFDKKLLIWAGIFAFLSLIMRISFPFFQNHYLGLLSRTLMTLPSLLGIFMIIKSYIGERDD